MVGGCVIVSGSIANELGGTRRAQFIAATCTAAAPVVLSLGHLLSTSVYDLLAWSLVTWLITHAIRTRSRAAWLVAGLVAGSALLNKPLIAFLLASAVVAIALVGPRDVLRSPWPWLAIALALAIWSPWLLWQSQHGWPQLRISSSIAHGRSASSEPRWALIPFQFLLAGPPLAAIWLAGLIGPLRRPDLRSARWLPVTWLLLAIAFELTGGKPYYLTGLLPALFALGAIQSDAWLARGRVQARRVLIAVALAATAAASAVIALPILPARDAGPVVAMNADIGETIGWPQLVAQIARAVTRAPRPTVIFTANYGEAGAIDRFGKRFGLPHAYSGHNGFADWGPPSGGQRLVVTVGLRATTVTTYFRDCEPVAQITNSAGIDNEERGALIARCAAPRESWTALWPRLRHLS